MNRQARALSAVALALFACVVTVAQSTDDAQDSGLVERSRATLAQIDIAVSGPPGVITSLRPEDFKIKVNRTDIVDFRLDPLCGPPAPEPAADPSAQPTPAAEPALPATYMFYFDQPHLTLAGRALAMDLARELAVELVTDGDRAMIVSNARRLEVIQSFTSDPELLLAAIDRLERDPKQMDLFTQQEESRLRQVVEQLNEQNNTLRAVAAARTFQKEELFQTDRDLRRLQLSLGQLVDADPPKAVLYFVDQIRANPGNHYLSYFGEALKRREATLSFMQTDVEMAGLAFDKVINAASAQGIRIYPVQAQGLVAPGASRPNLNGMTNGMTVSSNSRVRESDTRDTLANMAGETGGQAFLNGMSSERIADGIRDDSACVYLVSFDPTPFRQDSALRIVVKSRREGVRFHSRGRLVVQSESTRRTARLLRAFGAPGSIPDPVELNAHVVPTGFEDGSFTALLQLRLPGTPLQSATWDLGASVVRNDQVRDEASGRMTVATPGTAVVFEQELKLKPGAYEVVAVVQEEESGIVASRMVTVDWPEPTGDPAAVGRISIMQPGRAAFLRGEARRDRGAVALSDEDPVDSDRPVALVGLVCRGRRDRGVIMVERRLTGGSTVEYPPMELSLADQRCAQVRDLFPPETLSPGDYVYEIRLMRDGQPLGSTVREFAVTTPAS